MIERLRDTGWNNFKPMKEGQPSGATVHRTRPSDHGFADTAVGVRDLFRDHVECKEVAKASIPFNIVIEPSGHVVQTAPLNQELWHASKLNPTHLGICCVGDFREAPMPAAQRAALLGVCVGLVTSKAGNIRADEILGHTERPEGSAHPEWDSPGKTFSMQALRNDVKAAIRDNKAGSANEFAFSALTFLD